MKILKKIPTILTILLVLLLLAITLFNLICAIKRHTTGDQCPTVFGFATAVVISGSMEPTIAVNDLVVIHKQAEYAEGDIVTYRTETLPVTHRILTRTVGEDGTVHLVTAGDYTQSPDKQELTEADVVGRVIAILPQFGAIQAFLQRPLGFVLITVLLAVLILLPDLLRLSRAEKEAAAEEHSAKKAADPALQAQIEALEEQLRTQQQKESRRRWKWGLILLCYLAVLALILVLAQALGSDL